MGLFQYGWGPDLPVLTDSVFRSQPGVVTRGNKKQKQLWRSMSLTRFFKSADASGNLPDGYFLPSEIPQLETSSKPVEPNPEENPEPELIFEQEKRQNSSSLYSPEFAQTVVQYALEHSQISALRKYPAVTQQTLSRWIQRKKEGLHLIGRRGGSKSIFVGALNESLKALICDVRDSGQEVHCLTVSTHAEALLQREGKGSLLKSNGGNLVLDDSFASRWLKREGFALRAATRPKKKHVYVLTKK